jgi:catechol 2,3-dioxygenase-like lactoylglutathione lyase family enzyme
MEGTQFKYAIKFVTDMDKAVKFYRDVLGLRVKFESPGWSEFVTGETTLALHPASDKNPAGKVELGQGRSVQHASQEAGFRWGAGAVRRFRRRSLQRGRRGGIVVEAGVATSGAILYATNRVDSFVHRKRHRRGDHNGKHNLYKRPESQARQQGRHHGGRDPRA